VGINNIRDYSAKFCAGRRNRCAYRMPKPIDFVHSTGDAELLFGIGEGWQANTRPVACFASCSIDNKKSASDRGHGPRAIIRQWPHPTASLAFQSWSHDRGARLHM